MKNFVERTIIIKIGERKVIVDFMRWFKLFGYEIGWAKLRHEIVQRDHERNAQRKFEPQQSRLDGD